jgi:hypothetical protein
MIDKSRKKDHYFDSDYSPFLIEDEERGILRIPEKLRLEEVLKCQDAYFIDFIKVTAYSFQLYVLRNAWNLNQRRDLQQLKQWSILGLRQV